MTGTLSIQYLVIEGLCFSIRELNEKMNGGQLYSVILCSFSEFVARIIRYYQSVAGVDSPAVNGTTNRRHIIILYLPGNYMEERECIHRLINGVPGSIGEVVEAYKFPLFAFIMRMVNDYAIADDIFQDTWLRVIRSIHRFRGEAKFSTWLFQIALNLCRDAERHRIKWASVEFDERVHTSETMQTINPEQLVMKLRVQAILKELHPNMREVIVLKYYHDMSEEDIARVAGCPVGTVKSRLFKASAVIRKKMTVYEVLSDRLSSHSKTSR